jgi:DNA polymerase I
VDVARPSELATVARACKQRHEAALGAPGSLRLFNVDFSPGFRYALATDTEPVPARELRTTRLAIEPEALAAGDLDRLAVDGERLADDEATTLAALSRHLRATDPDVLVCRTAAVIPALFEAADRHDRDLRLGRREGYRQLAGESTFESYGRVGHSPARYDVPGRVVLDEANSFLWHKSDLAGLLDLVERSWKPLQEVGWASIGNVLTAIQIREALARDVLVPWNKWRPEAFKDVHTLHTADRGGFTFQPDVGLHEDVVEVDFASLYPRIICRYNISPDTLLCDCHADRADVPGLDYNVCDERGFLADVLEPILADRAEFKAEIATLEERRAERADGLSEAEAARLAALEARSSALKWILVSCFGYQGYRNSKFGRIECHEAINAVARDVLLTAKEAAERRGWRVVHGIVDSLWLARAPDASEEPAPVGEVVDAVSAAIDINLDLEARYDWVAFCPKRDGGGALTRYYGSFAGRDGFKVRGIEARQRSTPPLVDSLQRDLLGVVDAHRAPEPVVERAGRTIADLRAGRVDPADLVIRQRVSKPIEAYTQRTRAVAAARRARRHDVAPAPGQDVEYVVVDDDRTGPERVRLPFESVPGYDADFYADLVVRACESVVAPLGWDRAAVRRHLADGTNYELAAFR